MSDDHWSGKLVFVVGLALFVFALIDVPSIVMDDTDRNLPAMRTAFGTIPFWGGIIAMVVGGKRWHDERRIARGESPEAIGARPLYNEQVIVLSHFTGVSSTKIHRELKQRGITPAEWAHEHGIDPTTWRPAR